MLPEMPVLNIAVIGSQDLLRSMGKLSDTRDIESYVYKEGTGTHRKIISMIRPLNYPAKIRPLLSALNVSDHGIIEVTSLDAALGEAMVAFSSAGIEDGDLFINPKDGEWIDQEKVEVIKNQAGLKTWNLHASIPDLHEYRSTLLEKIPRFESDENLLVSVDQHFVVKGIGLVGIGYVRSGFIKKHDAIRIQPGGYEGVVRSLQVMDEDVDTAVIGDRVGVALRGVKDDVLDKGSQIVSSDSNVLVTMDRSEVCVNFSEFQTRPLNVNDIIHMSCDLQFMVGRVESIEGDVITVRWDRPIWVRSHHNKPPLVVQLDAGSMRICGSVLAIKPV